MRRALVLALPAAWMMLFFAAPFAILLAIAFGEVAEGLPPVAPPFRPGEGLQLNWENFRLLLEDPFYLDAALRSLRVAAVSAALCLLIGYPMA
ncbi:MAG TPA: putrescine ABC transporter permease PotH, partial [Acetobacteraceae bacterium]|nr:putrescine ABC transporter permease PotH [Acetobacteraceae bacterium]